MQTLTETIEWVDATKQLPDSDTTVLIHTPTLDEPVWLGYHDGEGWRSVTSLDPCEEGLPADPVDLPVKHWAHVPAGPSRTPSFPQPEDAQ